jgi:POT family proton-dependent oligopeptide transporter
MGRKVFIAVPPVGWKQYKSDVFSARGRKAIINLSIMYVFVAVFWSLFDQTGSSWVLQAERMDKWVNLGFVKFELLSSQIQAINPLLIMLFIPLFTSFLYPQMNKLFKLTAIRKIIIGMFIAGFSFALLALAQIQISAGATPSILWQFFAYVILTSAEVMVSITGLEFSYTQAPNSMKSFVMGLWLLSVALGNIITAQVSSRLQDFITLGTPMYFWFFAGLMFVTACLFILVASRYREESYIQNRDEKPKPLDLLTEPILTDNK